MIVLDASAAIELLLSTELGKVIARRLEDAEMGLHAPHLIDVEVAQALRRYVREGEIDSFQAETALTELRSLDLARHAHEPLLDRVWTLRDNLTAYDAVYVALAEAIDARLLTCDGRLARTPVAAGRVELVEEHTSP